MYVCLPVLAGVNSSDSGTEGFCNSSQNKCSGWLRERGKTAGQPSREGSFQPQVQLSTFNFSTFNLSTFNFQLPSFIFSTSTFQIFNFSTFTVQLFNQPIFTLTRYDKQCETLAVRILNIKNIPKNNKEVRFPPSIWRSLKKSWIYFKVSMARQTVHFQIRHFEFRRSRMKILTTLSVVRATNNDCPLSDWNGLQDVHLHLFGERLIKSNHIFASFLKSVLLHIFPQK